MRLCCIILCGWFALNASGQKELPLQDTLLISSDSLDCSTGAIEEKAVIVQAELVLDSVTNIKEYVYNKDTAYRSNFDQIITIDNKVITAHVTNIGLNQVYFRYPLNTIQNSISREMINCIIHKNGRKEIFTLVEKEEAPNLNADESFIIVREKKQWEEVDTTHNADQILGMNKLENISAKYESGKMRANAEYLEKNALIILRKKAANMGADLILITSKQMHAAYGDLPSIEMEGVAYSKDMVEQ